MSGPPRSAPSVIRVEGRRARARSLWLEMADHGPGDPVRDLDAAAGAFRAGR